MEPRILHHEVADGPGETVVLIPGGLTGIRSFDPLVPRFVDAGLRVVAVDPIANELGGQGATGDPGYDADVERDSLHLTIEAVAPGQPVHLVGWSNGGRAALAHALAHGDRVATVTAVEPAAWWLSDDPGAGALEALLAEAAGREVTEAQLLTFLETVVVAPPGMDHRTLPQWETWAGLRNALSWCHPQMRRTAEEQLEPLEPLAPPLLLCRGTWTAPFLREVVDHIAARVPGTRVQELDGGHACLLMSADDFVSATTEHVARARPA